MLGDAVKLLREVYGADNAIKNIVTDKKEVEEKLKFFTADGLYRLQKRCEEEKPVNNSAAEVIRYNDLLAKFKIYKIKFEAYCKMKENISQKTAIEKAMNKAIKETEQYQKEVVRIHSSFDNLKIEW